MELYTFIQNDALLRFIVVYTNLMAGRKYLWLLWLCGISERGERDASECASFEIGWGGQAGEASRSN